MVATITNHGGNGFSKKVTLKNGEQICYNTIL